MLLLFQLTAGTLFRLFYVLVPFIAGVSFLWLVAGLWPRFGHSNSAIYQELISVMHSLPEIQRNGIKGPEDSLRGPLIVKSVYCGTSK